MGLVYTGKDRPLGPSVNYKKGKKKTPHVTHRIQGNSTPRCEKQAFRKTSLCDFMIRKNFLKWHQKYFQWRKILINLTVKSFL